jgi:hypothetical protein
MAASPAKVAVGFARDPRRGRPGIGGLKNETQGEASKMGLLRGRRRDREMSAVGPLNYLSHDVQCFFNRERDHFDYLLS